VTLRAADVLLRAESDGGLTTRMVDIARGFRAGVGIALPVGKEFLDRLKDYPRKMAIEQLAGRLTGQDSGVTEAWLNSFVAAHLRRPMVAEFVDQLKAPGDAAHDALGGLHLPENLDDDENGKEPIGTQILSDIARELQNPDDPSTGRAREAFDAAMLRACRNRLDDQPGDSQNVRTILSSAKGVGLIEDDTFRKLSDAHQRELLRLVADLDEASVGAALAQNQDAGGARTEAAEKLADLVSLRIREIRQTGCGEAAAIEILKQTDPDLVAQMDRVLAYGGENGAPGAWLETRKQLVAMRERVKTLAEDGQVSGTDLQRLMSASLREIAMNVFESAAKTIDRQAGRFTVLGLGSTARGEASPYSDLEFAILLPDDHTDYDRAYATELTQRVRDQIAAVGENGSYYLEHGFHFDPGVNPLDVLFMNTADGLVANGLSPGGNIDKDWSRTSLLNAEWFYGGDVRRDNADVRTEPEESWQALKDFHAKVVTHLNREVPLSETEARGVRPGETEGQWLGRENIKAALELAKPAIEQQNPDVVDVKELARLPMLLVQVLAVQHGLLRDPQTGIAANNIDQRLTLLVEGNVISRQDAEGIRNLQDELSGLRVRSHVMHGKQVDNVALTEEVGRQEGLLYDPGLAKLVENAQALYDRANTYVETPRERF
jgi:hypothetical protein